MGQLWRGGVGLGIGSIVYMGILSGLTKSTEHPTTIQVLPTEPSTIP